MHYRKVMEKAIGRKLERWEHVHHKDHDRSNSDLSNLEHCPTPQDHAREHTWTDEQLIEWLIQYSDEYGRLPRSQDVNQHPGMPHSSTYARRFGTWKAALRAAQFQIDLLNAQHGGYDYNSEIEIDWEEYHSWPESTMERTSLSYNKKRLNRPSSSSTICCGPRRVRGSRKKIFAVRFAGRSRKLKTTISRKRFRISRTLSSRRTFRERGAINENRSV